MGALCCEKCRYDIIEHLRGVVEEPPLAQTYGELLETAYPVIFSETPKDKRDCFINLGAGTGRSLLYAIANGFRRAKGVEIVKERVEYGKKHVILPVRNQIKGRVTLSHASITHLTKDYFTRDEKESLVIWWSNLCLIETERSKI